MPNIFDYLLWRSDLTFDNAEPNEIDALIFSELSYVPFEKIVPELGTRATITLSEAAEKFFEINGEKSIYTNQSCRWFERFIVSNETDNVVIM